MCVIREFLGSGTFGAGLIEIVDGSLKFAMGTAKGIQIFPADYGIMYMILPFGGFVTLGVLIALMQYVLAKSAAKAEAKKEQEVNE
jgi:electron transport complex protein RnfE